MSSSFWDGRKMQTGRQQECLLGQLDLTPATGEQGIRKDKVRAYQFHPVHSPW